jgi:hypothetical protein
MLPPSFLHSGTISLKFLVTTDTRGKEEYVLTVAGTTGHDYVERYIVQEIEVLAPFKVQQRR